jgi:indolepyruvate ferredoxin oxidoreductase alpha subunit
MPFNFYRGPEKPELMVVTSGSGWMYSLEGTMNLNLQDRIGILKLGTTWPLPESLLLDHLKKVDKVLFIEEVDPFLENNVKEIYAQHCLNLGLKAFYGKMSKHVPDIGELNPEIVIHAIQNLVNISYEPRPADYSLRAQEAASELIPARALGFCAGCPHRATYWAVKGDRPRWQRWYCSG